MLQTLGQAPAAKKQKQQQAFAAAIPSFEAQYLATTFVQYILPEGAYSNPRQAAIDLLHELAALPEPEADVEAKVAQCARCGQTLMGQAWEGPDRKAAETNLFCKASKQPGMEWQNLFRNDEHFNELDVCTRFLQATPIRSQQQQQQDLSLPSRSGLQQAQQQQTEQQQEQQQPAALQVRHCQLQQHQIIAEALVSQTQSESLPNSNGEQQASTSDVSGHLGNTTAKASSFQETYRGLAVGNIILKGTPAVLVAELKSASAPTAVGYARTSLDMAAQENSDFVPLELVAIDEDALDAHALDLPFRFQGEIFCLAFPSASGPRTLGDLLQEHKFEWPGIALRVTHPDLNWDFDRLVKRLGRPRQSPNRAGRAVSAIVESNINNTNNARGKRKPQPSLSTVAEPAIGVENEDNDDEACDSDIQGASQAKISEANKEMDYNSGPQSKAAGKSLQARVTRSKRLKA
ncbi:TPA: hypothetical protein ACH3X1_008196 [Trebouxia sp. C0004]